MRTFQVDATEMSTRQIREMLVNLRNECNKEAIILLGHGSDSGTEFMNLDSKKIIDCDIHPSILWLFACNCGKSMITEIATTGVLTVGHICNVLWSRDNDIALNAVIQLLSDIEKTNCNRLISSIRRKWFEIAGKCLSEGDIFIAASINQLRLSVRCSQLA